MDPHLKLRKEICAVQAKVVRFTWLRFKARTSVMFAQHDRTVTRLILKRMHLKTNSMTKSDIEILKQDISEGINPQRLRFNDYWIRAFKQYNEDPENKTLGMGCVPCYLKVYRYHKDKTND